MFDITAEDLYRVYNQLKDKYELQIANSLFLDPGFTVDCPVLVGKANGLTMWLYEDAGLFIMDVLNADHTKGTHFHPTDVEDALCDIVAFMEGTEKYTLSPFPNR